MVVVVVVVVVLTLVLVLVLVMVLVLVAVMAVMVLGLAVPTQCLLQTCRWVASCTNSTPNKTQTASQEYG